MVTGINSFLKDAASDDLNIRTKGIAEAEKVFNKTLEDMQNKLLEAQTKIKSSKTFIETSNLNLAKETAEFAKETAEEIVKTIEKYTSEDSDISFYYEPQLKAQHKTYYNMYNNLKKLDEARENKDEEPYVTMIRQMTKIIQIIDDMRPSLTQANEIIKQANEILAYAEAKKAVENAAQDLIIANTLTEEVLDHARHAKEWAVGNTPVKSFFLTRIKKN